MNKMLEIKAKGLIAVLEGEQLSEVGTVTLEVLKELMEELNKQNKEVKQEKEESCCCKSCEVDFDEWYDSLDEW